MMFSFRDLSLNLTIFTIWTSRFMNVKSCTQKALTRCSIESEWILVRDGPVQGLCERFLSEGESPSGLESAVLEGRVSLTSHETNVKSVRIVCFNKMIISQSPQSLVKELRQRIESFSDLQIKEVFRFFDKNHSGTMDFDQFRIGLSKLGFSLSPTENKALFHFFDKKGTGSISFMNFVSTITCIERTEDVYLTQPVQIIQQIQVRARERYQSLDHMLANFKQQSYTPSQFLTLINQHISDSFSDIQLIKVYEHIDFNNKCLVDKKSLQILYFTKLTFRISKEVKPDSSSPDSKKDLIRQIGLKELISTNIQLLEDLVINLSTAFTKVTQKKGKSKSQFLQVFLQFPDRISENQFKGMCKFLVGQNAGIGVLYTLLRHPITKNVKLTHFMDMIRVGLSYPLAYVEFKKSCRKNAIQQDVLRQVMLKQSSRRVNDFLITLDDFQNIFKNLQLVFSEQAIAQLQTLGVKDPSNSQQINVMKVIKIMYPANCPVAEWVQRRAALKIIINYRLLKLRRLKYQLEDKKDKKQEKKDKQKSKEKDKKKGKAKPDPKRKKDRESKKEEPKEQKKDEKLDFLKLSLNIGKDMVSNIIDLLLERSVALGQKKSMAHQISQFYKQRPVRKQIFYYQRKNQFEVTNPIINLGIFPQLGKILLLSRQNNLYDFDLPQSKLLSTITLKNATPFKRSVPLDVQYDQLFNKLFVINNRWMLEVWDLTLKKNSPVGRIRLLTNSKHLSEMLKKLQTRSTESNLGSKLLRLSSPSHKLLIVNATMVNNSFYFIDPINFTIVDNIYLNFPNINSAITKSFTKQLLDRLQHVHLHKNIPALFKSLYRSSVLGLAVHVNTFNDVIMQAEQSLGGKSKLSSQPKPSLIFNGLYQNQLQSITQQMIVRLAQDIIRNMKSKKTRQLLQQNELGMIVDEINEIFNGSTINFSQYLDAFGRANLLKSRLLQFFKMTISDASKPNHQFLDSLRPAIELLIGQHNNKLHKSQIQRLIQFFKENSDPKSLLQEIFGCPTTIQENSQGGLMNIFVQNFDCGYNITEIILNIDTNKRGWLTRYEFVFLLKTLPVGLDDDTVRLILDNQIEYTQTGNINYLDLFKNPRYMDAEQKFKLRRLIEGGLNKQVNFAEDKIIMKHFMKKSSKKQKIIVSKFQYIENFDMLVLSPSNPASEKISLCVSKRTFDCMSLNATPLSEFDDYYNSVLLAQLEGHRAQSQPVFIYVSQNSTIISGDNFSSYQQNRNADILIWKLSEDLMGKHSINPHWVIHPSFRIPHAHSDSITSIVYLDHAQFILSTSVDKVVKVWDPISQGPSIQVNRLNQQGRKLPLVKKIFLKNQFCIKMVSKFISFLEKFHPEDVGQNHNMQMLILLTTTDTILSQGKFNAKVHVLYVRRMTIQIPLYNVFNSISESVNRQLQMHFKQQGHKFSIAYKFTLSRFLQVILSRKQFIASMQKKIFELIKQVVLVVQTQSRNKAVLEQLFQIFKQISRVLSIEKNIDQYSVFSNIVFLYLSSNNFFYPYNISYNLFTQMLAETFRPSLKSSKGLQYLKNHLRKRSVLNSLLKSLRDPSCITPAQLQKFIIDNKILKAENIRIFLENIEFLSGELKVSEFLQRLKTEKIDLSKIAQFLGSILEEGPKKLAQIRLEMHEHQLKNSTFILDKDFTKILGKHCHDTFHLNQLAEFVEEEQTFEGQKVIDVRKFIQNFFTFSTNKRLDTILEVINLIRKALAQKGNSVSWIFKQSLDLHTFYVQQLKLSKEQFIMKIKQLSLGCSHEQVLMVSNFLSSIQHSHSQQYVYFSTAVHYFKLSQSSSSIQFQKKKFTSHISELKKYEQAISQELKGRLLKGSLFRFIIKKLNIPIPSDLIDFIIVNYLMSQVRLSQLWNMILSTVQEQDLPSARIEERLHNYHMNLGKDQSEEQEEMEEDSDVEQKIANDLKSSKKRKKKNLSVSDMKVTKRLFQLLKINYERKFFNQVFNACRAHSSQDRIRISVFESILRSKLNSTSEEYRMIEGFIEEWESNRGPLVNYQELLGQSAEVAEEKEPQSRLNEQFQIGQLVRRIYSNMKKYNVQVQKAFLFFNDQEQVTVEVLRKLLQSFNFRLEQSDYEVLKWLRNSQGLYQLKQLERLIGMVDRNVAITFDQKKWFSISQNLSQSVFEKLNVNSSLIKFIIKKKLRSLDIADQYPCITSQLFVECLRQSRIGFSDEDITRFTIFGIMGSQEQPKFNKQYLQIGQFKNVSMEIINCDLFLQAISVLLRKRNSIRIQSIAHSMDLKAPQSSEESKILVNKMRLHMLQQGVSILDILGNLNIPFMQNQQIKRKDLKKFIRNLNLKLSLNEEIKLLQSLEDEKGVILLDRLMELLEGQKNLKHKKNSIILNKLSLYIFYKNMTLKELFNSLAQDTELLYREQLLYGLSKIQLNVGLTEIGQFLQWLGLDKDFLTLHQFSDAFAEKFKELKINPLQDHTIALLNDIKLLSQQGKSLQTCLKEQDILQTGNLSYQGQERGFLQFGLKKLNRISMLSIHKIYQNFKNMSKHVDMVSIIPDSLENDQTIEQQLQLMYRKEVSIKDLCHALHSAVEYYSKTLLDQTDNLLRKLYTVLVKLKGMSLFQSFCRMSSFGNSLTSSDLKIGLNSFETNMTPSDIEIIWRSFKKSEHNKVCLLNFIKRFAHAGAIGFLEVNDSIENIVQKLLRAVRKMGNLQEVFNKLDIKKRKSLNFSQFQQTVRHHQISLSEKQVIMLFKHITANYKNDSTNSEIRFNYKDFSTVVYNFRNNPVTTNTAYRLACYLSDRKLSWLELLKDKLNKQGRANQATIRTALKQLKFLSSEQIQLVMNFLDKQQWECQQLDQIFINLKRHLESELYVEEAILTPFLNKLYNLFFKEEIDISKIIKTKELGCITLDQFNQALDTMEITASKQQIKLLFSRLNAKQNSFISTSKLIQFIKKKKNPGPQPVRQGQSFSQKIIQEEILLKLRQGFRHKAFKEIMQKLSLKNNSNLNIPILQRLLNEVGVRLSKDEVAIVYSKIAKSQQKNSSKAVCSDLIEYLQEKRILHGRKDLIDPQVYSKLQQLSHKLLQLQLDPKATFQLFLRQPPQKVYSQEVILKEDFLQIMQSMNLNLGSNRELLLMIYEFFDSAKIGSITEDRFVSHLQIFASNELKKLKVQSIKSQQEKLQENQEKDPIKVNAKKAMLNVMQTLYLHLEAKKFSKKQLVAIFDINGNGFISKDDLIQIIRKMNLNLGLERLKILAKFLDSQNKNSIKISYLISVLADSIPAAERNQLKFRKLKEYLLQIVKILGSEEENLHFITQIINSQKALPNVELSSKGTRLRTGIEIKDFTSTCRLFDIVLDIQKMDLIIQSSRLSQNSNFLNVHLLFDQLQSNLWEVCQCRFKQSNSTFNKKLIRNFCLQVKKNNYNIDQIFKILDPNESGLISNSTLTRFLGLFQSQESQKLCANLPSHSFSVTVNQLKRQLIDTYTTSSNERNSVSFPYVLSNFPLEFIFSQLDHSKMGFIDYQNFELGLVQLGLKLKRKQAKELYFNISQKRNDCITYQDLQLYKGDLNRIKSSRTQLSFQGKQFYQHIVKVINQRMISLWKAFVQFDQVKSETISLQVFGRWMSATGLELSDEQLQELANDIMQQSHTNSVRFYRLNQALYRQGLRIYIKNDAVQYKWFDRFVVAFSKMFLQASEVQWEQKQIKEALTPKELFKYIFKVGQEKNLTVGIINQLRLHGMGSRLTDVIAYFKEYNHRYEQFRLMKLKKSFIFNQYLQVSIQNLQQIMNDSWVQRLFKSLKLIAQPSRPFHARGAQILSSQIMFSQFSKLLHKVEQKAQNIIVQLQKLALQFFMAHHKNTQQPKVAELPKCRIRYEQSMPINDESQKVSCLTPYVNSYESQLNLVFLYSKFIVQNSFDKIRAWWAIVNSPNIVQASENQQFVTQQHMFSKIQFLSYKKVGLNDQDKDLFIWLEKPQGVSLQTICNCTGGIARIPFLRQTKAVENVIKFWAMQIFQIFKVIQSFGMICCTIRPKDIIVTERGTKLVVTHLRGLMTPSDNSDQVLDYIELPQQDRVIPKFQNYDSFEDYRRALEIHESEVRCDPYLPLEFRLSKKITYQTHKYLAGAFLYKLLFNKEPPTINRLLKNQLPKDYNLPLLTDQIMRDILDDDGNVLVAALDGKINSEIEQILKLSLAWLTGGNNDWPWHWKDIWKQHIAKQLVPWIGLNPRMSFNSSSTIKWMQGALQKLLNADLKNLKKEQIDQIHRCIKSLTETAQTKSSPKFSELKKSMTVQAGAELYSNFQQSFRAKLVQKQSLRCSNFNINGVKFTFDAKILDKIILIHNQVVAVSRRGKFNKELTLAVCAMLQTMFLTLQSYESSFSPYIDQLIRNTLKLLFGHDPDLAKESKPLQAISFNEGKILIFELIVKVFSKTGIGATGLNVLQEYLKSEPLVNSVYMSAIIQSFELIRLIETNIASPQIITQLQLIITIVKAKHKSKTAALADIRLSQYLLRLTSSNQLRVQQSIFRYFLAVSDGFAKSERKENDLALSMLLSKKNLFKSLDILEALTIRSQENSQLLEIFNSNTTIYNLMRPIASRKQEQTLKEICLRIILNLTQAGKAIVQKLFMNQIFYQVFRLLVQNNSKKIICSPQNTVILSIYNQIYKSGKRLIVNHIKSVPGLSTFLQSERLRIPQTFSRSFIQSRFAQVTSKVDEMADSQVTQLTLQAFLKEFNSFMKNLEAGSYEPLYYDIFEFLVLRSLQIVEQQLKVRFNEVLLTVQILEQCLQRSLDNVLKQVQQLSLLSSQLLELGQKVSNMFLTNHISKLEQKYSSSRGIVHQELISKYFQSYELRIYQLVLKALARLMDFAQASQQVTVFLDIGFIRSLQNFLNRQLSILSHIVTQIPVCSTDLFKDYVIQFNFRIKSFYFIIKNCKVFEQQILQSDFINEFLDLYMASEAVLDLSSIKEALVYEEKRFIPARMQFLLFFDLIFSLRKDCQNVYQELMFQSNKLDLNQFQLISVSRKIGDQKSRSAIMYFALIMRNAPKEIIEIMKNERMLQGVRRIIEQNADFRRTYRQLLQQLVIALNTDK